MKTINKYVNIVSGIMFILVSVIMLAMSANIVQRASTQSAVGPEFLPKVIALFILVTSGLLIFTDISKRRKGFNDTGSFPEEKKDIVTVLMTIITLILYVSILVTFGFIIASALFLFVILSILDIHWKSHVIRNIIVSISVPTISFLLFRYVFSLTLPAGILF